MKTFILTIVSPEKKLYEGKAVKLFATSLNGELEILYGHAKLLAKLVPAPIWIEQPDGNKEAIVVFGGILETQAEQCIILADTGIRAVEIDAAKALNAKREAERILKQPRKTGTNYYMVKKELAFAQAQLKVMQYILNKKKSN